MKKCVQLGRRAYAVEYRIVGGSHLQIVALNFAPTRKVALLHITHMEYPVQHGIRAVWICCADKLFSSLNLALHKLQRYKG